jgi:hypothetical protein
MPTDIFELTGEFAEQVLDLPAPSEPTRLSPERKTWFIRAANEELTEFAEAGNLEDEIDAIIDLIYFAAGRLHEMGVKGGIHFEEVHGANCKKKRGRLEKRSHGLSAAGGLDATKPEGWTPPDHRAILDFLAGHRGELFKTQAETVHIRKWPKPKKSKWPKILVLGHARHGKDTVAEVLRDEYGFSFASSSHFCAERVMMPYYNSKMGHPGYANVEDCYADRVNNRAEWFNQIQAYNSPDRGRLAREILETSDLYVGMRCKEEFAAAKDAFDFILWVDATERGLPLEPEDSFDIEFDPQTMILVPNNGTLEDLNDSVYGLVANTFFPGD